MLRPHPVVIDHIAGKSKIKIDVFPIPIGNSGDFQERLFATNYET